MYVCVGFTSDTCFHPPNIYLTCGSLRCDEDKLPSVITNNGSRSTKDFFCCCCCFWKIKTKGFKVRKDNL